jgi:hypothetical protein
MQQASVHDRPKRPASTRRRWPWWLRSPHSRLFSEWIELKNEREGRHPGADNDARPSAA